MKILVIRHAVALEREKFMEANDDLRPLTKKGIEEFEKVSALYKKLYPNIEQIYSSELTRAVQTAEILKKRYKMKYQVLEELRPEVKPEMLLNKLKKTKKDFVTIVGHEPALSAFIGFALTGNNTSFVVMKKGGACLIEINNGAPRILELHNPKAILKI